MSPHLADLAEGLSEAQRRAIVQFDAKRWSGISMPSLSASRMKGSLTKLGLLERQMVSAGYREIPWYRLSLLGISLRNHLLSQGKEKSE